MSNTSQQSKRYHERLEFTNVLQFIKPWVMYVNLRPTTHAQLNVNNISQYF